MVACARAKRVRRIFCSYSVSTVKCLLIISEVVKSHGQISAVKSGQILGPNKKSTTRLWGSGVSLGAERECSTEYYVVGITMCRRGQLLPPRSQSTSQSQSTKYRHRNTTVGTSKGELSCVSPHKKLCMLSTHNAFVDVGCVVMPGATSALASCPA